MKFGAIASTLLGVIGTSAAFTVHWRISAGVPLVSKDIHGSGSANFRRSMVAMEPEKAVGNNEKVDQMKPPTSILKPEDLMEEIDEASGFSQWQRSYDDDDEEDDDSFENAFSNELEKSTVEEEEEEAEEVLQAREIEENLEEELDVAVEADAEAEDEEEIATKEIFAFEEDVGADESKGLEVAAEAEVESTKVNPIAMASKNVAKLNFIFRILNRAMVSNEHAVQVHNVHV
jgi:recombination DNA repair RAD52 pathway protein